MDVGVALLIEYLGIILVVLWVWALTRRTAAPAHRARHRPGPRRPRPRPRRHRPGDAPTSLGVLWGLLAAAGLAGHYVLAGRPTAMPAAAFAGLGLAVGAVALAVLGARRGPAHGGRRRRPSSSPEPSIPAWLALARAGRSSPRPSPTSSASSGPAILGSTLASFVGLTEVLFAVLFAWLLLGELPGPLQLARRRSCCSRVSSRCGSASATGAHGRGRVARRPISTFPRPSPRLGGLPRRGTSHRPELSGQTAERSTHP